MAGFPQYGWKSAISSQWPSVRLRGQSRLPLAIRVATASDFCPGVNSPFGQSPYSLRCLLRETDPQVLRSALGCHVPVLQTLLRPDPPVSRTPRDLWIISPGLCVAAVRVTFPSLPCQTCSGCHHPYPVRETCRVRRFLKHASIVFAENRAASTLNRFRLNWVHAGVNFEAAMFA